MEGGWVSSRSRILVSLSNSRFIRFGPRADPQLLALAGGHRYAGNVIIYLPNGTSIWYGRVTPRDIGAVVSRRSSRTER